MARSLILRRAELSKYGGTLSQRAAQYVRMSTVHQRYSIENQAAAIATYAARYSLAIVRTYRDDGISGLRIKKREGLKQLITDVCSGSADFSRILVYDVSRWGRFQDVDESAHYEFLCRNAGIRVEYCAEQFDNDGSLFSSIIKNLKPVMAAEFSRELSVKVHDGHCRVSSLGFRPGGPLSYGLRRELVDENRISKGPLRRGQEKHLKTDRVVLKLGPPEEIEVVQRIFREFVEQRCPAEEIARRLTTEGIRNHHRRAWSSRMVMCVLQNENFIGNTVYNRESNRLHLNKVSNPPSEWIRSLGILPAVIDRSLFLRAQRRITLRWERNLPDEELLRRLKGLLDKQGRLSASLINKTLGLPSSDHFIERFGGLQNAYRLIGYEPERDLDWVTRKGEFETMVKSAATDLSARFEKEGLTVHFDRGPDVLTVDGMAVSLRLARLWMHEGREPLWIIRRRVVMPKGLILAVRLKEKNREILDYFVMPTQEMKARRIHFVAGSSRLEPYRHEDLHPPLGPSSSTLRGAPGPFRARASELRPRSFFPAACATLLAGRRFR